jgi:DNA invertase Pin-like site-specific DNA recombinase
MIACYCRVSSARQKTDSQKPEIRRWLEGNGRAVLPLEVAK